LANPNPNLKEDPVCKMLGNILSKTVRGGVRLTLPSTSISAVSYSRFLSPTFTKAVKSAIALPNASRAVSISTSTRNLKGLSPDSENPKVKDSPSHEVHAAPSNLTIEEYNKLSDEYMELLYEKFDEVQEERVDVDVEYYVCFSNHFPLLYFVSLLTILSLVS
jgi:hypothetical protein